MFLNIEHWEESFIMVMHLYREEKLVVYKVKHARDFYPEIPYF